MTRDRKLLAQLIKEWAQYHDYNFIIADSDPTDQGVANTGSFLTWLVQQKQTNIDLVELLNKLELFMENVRKRKFPDGMYCRKCQVYYEFAEGNQPDGTLLCYSCRSDPYR